MEKLMAVSVGLAFAFGATQVQASPTIEDFISADNASSYFNCAYKRKIASKKCLVTRTQVKSSIDVRTKQFYGVDYMLPLLTIRWPDGDKSRYISMDSFEVINLADKKAYRYKTLDMDNWDYDLSKGLIIENADGKEHIRLW